MKSKHLIVSMILTVVLLIGATSPKSNTNEIQVYAGSSAIQIHNAFIKAANEGKPIKFAPGTYLIDRGVVVREGSTVDARGAKFVGTQPCVMFVMSGNTTWTGGEFSARVAGVTGIGGEFARTVLRDADFQYSLRYGVNGTGLIAWIERCDFGTVGVSTGNFQALRIVSPEQIANLWSIRDCLFYSSHGPEVSSAVEFDGGNGLVFEGCNFEWNGSQWAVVAIHGMNRTTLRNCWFENNSSKWLVDVRNSTGERLSTYSVISEGNYYQITDKDQFIWSDHVGASIRMTGDQGYIGVSNEIIAADQAAKVQQIDTRFVRP